MKTSFRCLPRFSELRIIPLGRVLSLRVLIGIVEQSTGILGAGLSWGRRERTRPTVRLVLLRVTERAQSLAFQDLILNLAQEPGQVGDRFGQAGSETEQVEVGH